MASWKRICEEREQKMVTAHTEKGEPMMKVKVKTAVDKEQVFFIPTMGVIFHRHTYGYGYGRFSIAFAWLIWRGKIQFDWRKER